MTKHLSGAVLLLGLAALSVVAYAQQGGKPITPFVEPKDPRGDAKAKAEYEAYIAKHGKNPSPAATKSRGANQNNFSGKGPYWGINGLIWYSNDGAEKKNLFGKIESERDYSCGQAAAATILRLWKALPDDRSNAAVRNLYNKYPRDGYLGIAGTSWQRVRSMLQDNGLSVAIIKGENDLKANVANGQPVIVMLDIAKFPEWNYQWGGHWVVVYGYTKERVYLSNWPGNGSTTWSDFRKGWINNNIVNGGGMSEMGIVGTGSRGRLGQ